MKMDDGAMHQTRDQAIRLLELCSNLFLANLSDVYDMGLNIFVDDDPIQIQKVPSVVTGAETNFNDYQVQVHCTIVQCTRY